ncbi:hypothetical protein AnaeK_3944 [Anaeromyxobacter sp. K]|nr:hypothetical protein AnaeK_3944 [Anaeromyxobacter sp. K]
MNSGESNMSKPSFQDWFCLREGRKNFQIDPVRDQKFLFGQPEWEAQIDSRLKRAQLLSTPVRLLWWGQYGIGKTHRLRHTEYLVRAKLYRYTTCYVVATDLQEKTGFETLHFELVNSLGRERMQALVSAYLLKLRTGAAGVPSLDEICGSASDVRDALMSFGGDNKNLVLPAWRFLCGLELKSEEQKLAGVTKERLETSHDFAAVLSALARIIQLETQTELLYLVDEAENLIKITNKTAEARWQETLRAVLDIQHLSIVITVGSERFQDMPKLLVLPDIVRRVQKDNYVHMEAFKQPDVEKFMRMLLEQLIDPTKREALEASGALTNTPGYKREYFPFNQGAFEKYCENAVVDPRTAKPSEILARLDKVAADAYFNDRRIIDRDHLTELGIA